VVANITDPQSRIMPTRKGFLQGYNAQIAVTGDHMIVAVSLGQSTNDQHSLVPMMNAAQTAAARCHEASQRPEHLIGTVLADAGYASDANLAAPGPDRIIALNKGRDQAPAADHHAVHPPAASATPRQLMAHRLGTPDGHALYKRRGATVEPAIANLKKILDRFSRRALGWSLDRTLAARLPQSALRQAIAERQPAPGLVHHSDCGVQYACREYGELLEAHGIVPSMSRRANPYDNAVCESFMKTLKYEEIHCNRYDSLEELAAHMDEFIGEYYNHQRLHSALGYQTPARFEAALPRQNGRSAGLAATETMSFSGHREIYRSDVLVESGELMGSSPAHRHDESPTGYSPASCSPAALASASPASSDSEAQAVESQ